MLISRGFATSEKEARILIMEGRVRANNDPIATPGDLVLQESKIEIIPSRLYASRGGIKLEGAFRDFNLTANGKTAADIGASTGGFTDYLLKNSAKKITAIDVGYGLLSWELRNSDKVEVMERTNMRHIEPKSISEKVQLAVVDLSFISVEKVFQKILDITLPDAEILILVKPQFELRREDVRHKGIVREAALHAKALKNIVAYLSNYKINIESISFSRIKGTKGNIEFWIYLKKTIKSAKSNLNYDKIISGVVKEAHIFFD